MAITTPKIDLNLYLCIYIYIYIYTWVDNLHMYIFMKSFLAVMGFVSLSSVILLISDLEHASEVLYCPCNLQIACETHRHELIINRYLKAVYLKSIRDPFCCWALPFGFELVPACFYIDPTCVVWVMSYKVKMNPSWSQKRFIRTEWDVYMIVFSTSDKILSLKRETYEL